MCRPSRCECYVSSLTWPISELSINKSGVFGDSFGALTALFSGLAFAGMIVTILLQGRELKLQRRDIRKNRIEHQRSAAARERSARLVALSTLLAEYKHRIELNEESLRRVSDHTTGTAMALQQENQKIIEKRDEIIGELERIIHVNDEILTTFYIDHERRRFRVTVTDAEDSLQHVEGDHDLPLANSPGSRGRDTTMRCPETRWAASGPTVHHGFKRNFPARAASRRSARRSQQSTRWV